MILTPVMPPFGILQHKPMKKMNQLLGSVRASMAWCFFHRLFLIPVKLSLTRSMALMRSSFDRNRAFIGVSGRV